jgi:hydrogenase maturation protease
MVVGVGNEDRGDDAIGPAVVRSLSHILPGSVTLRCRGGDLMSLIEEWDGFDTVICIDAGEPQRCPGRIERLDLSREPLPGTPALVSSHAYGLSDTIELARALGGLPNETIVYAIEGASFALGTDLSPMVVAAMPEVVHLVTNEVVQLLEERDCA